LQTVFESDAQLEGEVCKVQGTPYESAAPNEKKDTKLNNKSANGYTLCIPNEDVDKKQPFSTPSYISQT